MLTTSEPAFGSLIASAPTCSPETSLGRYFFFCASLPLRCIWLTARFECAPYERPDRRRRARDLLHRDDVGEVAEVAAAVLLLHRHAVQAERAELFPQVGGEEVVAVDVGGARRDLVGGELLHGVAQHVDRLAEAEGEAGKVGHGRLRVVLCGGRKLNFGRRPDRSAAPSGGQALLGGGDDAPGSAAPAPAAGR